MIFCEMASSFMGRFQIAVLVTAQDANNLHKYMLESHFFGEKFRLNAPNRSQRSEVF